MAEYKHPPWMDAEGFGAWQPGQWGKGYLHEEGLTTWGTGHHHDGYPFHSVIQNITGAGQKMAQDGTFYGDPCVDLWINPEGKVAYWNRPGMNSFVSNEHLPVKDKLAQIGKQVEGYDSRLKSLDGWIDDHFYPQHHGDDRKYPCPRCHHPEDNADGSCPNCNYRPESGTTWERSTASDPTPPTPQRLYRPNRDELDEQARKKMFPPEDKDEWKRLRDELFNHPDVTVKPPVCPECGEPKNAHGDCENATCYASPDFHGYKSSGWSPNVVESQSHPITSVGDAHHRQDRRPVVYLPHRNSIYVGNPGCHHTQLRNEFEIQRHHGVYGYIRPGGVDWLNGIGMPEEVEDVLRERYVGNGWDKDLKEWAL